MYLWIKAIHVIAVISWMAGLFYLPRLFVYHCDAPVGSAQSETFKVMERRLLRVIMNPAMILAWACGLAMITLDPGLLKGAGWLHAKLSLVVLMTAMHMAMARWRRAFAEDRNTKSARFFRMANEVPTLLMILIVILVIVRPF
ncbi:protoporphyrinogen oxidase HemJ [Nitrospirillum sp. BR 11163]|uniref:protoporphyrinogen oxidase HemJ n=1 Tax=Nitrospirillum sp. BR 11163 TaxID=3104323 RepID=UPI002AFE44B3|nr:protoporphyrinogen oxidase HemJ [Nitrospirillum sp. BR 11163]MEA1677579.1 protoporphyrinogen oxidase HemJ [Nitrospirillum sp. BR 11163]